MPIYTGLNESALQVGIVLAADDQKSVEVDWPWDMSPGGDIALLPSTIQACSVLAAGDRIRIQAGGNHVEMEKFELSLPDALDVLGRRTGFHLRPVATGRGFHWQKEIDIYLPGRLTFRAEAGRLIVVNTLDVESYVACVATSEMGAAAPDALLAAQTVVARCWALALVEHKHDAEGFHVCNDDCCQRYQGTTYLTEYSLRAARETAGQVLVHDEHVIDARYSKNCGGIVEAYENIWVGGPVAYLVPLWDARGIQDPPRVSDFNQYYEFDDAYCAPPSFAGQDLQAMLGKVDVAGSYYRWEYTLKITTLLENLAANEGIQWKALTGLKILERGNSARIKSILLHGVTAEGEQTELELVGEYAIRRSFSSSFLYSSAFEILNSDHYLDEGRIRMRGCGWGHGVGLCQMGALGMALKGRSAPEILEHYYPGTELLTMD